MSRITYVFIYFAPSKLQIFFSFENNPFLNILGGIDIRGEYSQTYKNYLFQLFNDRVYKMTIVSTRSIIAQHENHENNTFLNIPDVM
jgi:hypothetical protein